MRSRVWRIEEKKTDVALAICLYRDVAKGRCDRLILVSNDSDAEPALKAVRQDFPQVVIGVVMPVRAGGGDRPERRASGSLAAQANWTMRSLPEGLLRAAQLPPWVPTNKKPIRKPSHW